jgi:hypothetical protein
MRRRPRKLRNAKFGRLIALKHKGKRWLCLCECGKRRWVLTANLSGGRTRSCGCWEKQSRLTNHLIHGDSRVEARASEYRAWSHLKDRCLNPRNGAYANYGGRGIRVCKRWMKYENFLADMGRRPKNRTLDRVNNDGNYDPKNCRWATLSEQAYNRRPK